MAAETGSRGVTAADAGAGADAGNEDKDEWLLLESPSAKVTAKTNDAHWNPPDPPQPGLFRTAESSHSTDGIDLRFEGRGESLQQRTASSLLFKWLERQAFCRRWSDNAASSTTIGKHGNPAAGSQPMVVVFLVQLIAPPTFQGHTSRPTTSQGVPLHPGNGRNSLSAISLHMTRMQDFSLNLYALPIRVMNKIILQQCLLSPFPQPPVRELALVAECENTTWETRAGDLRPGGDDGRVLLRLLDRGGGQQTQRRTRRPAEVEVEAAVAKETGVEE
ncbi:MAG: hypothetical protein LQ341_007504 [Variospora aurantia]|nr:MAG: hypothetical protein LQ341_007504 [Variospora aurantia]